jgi:hypothetical protein
VTLVVEGEGPLASPSPCHLRAAVERMGHYGGPTCVAVECRGSYACAAGGGGRYTAEWHEPTTYGFRHWVAGRPHGHAGAATVQAGAFEITVGVSECLGATEVLAILEAFLRGHGRPVQFAWRDITDELV